MEDSKNGRTVIIESRMMAIQAVLDVTTSLKTAWTTICPPLTSEKLDLAIKSFNGLVKSMVPTEHQLLMVQYAAEGVFSVLRVLTDGIKLVIGAGFTLAGKVLPPVANGIINVAGAVGKATSTFLSLGHDGIGAATGGLKTFIGWVSNTKPYKAANGYLSSLRGEFTKIGSYVKREFIKLPIGTLQENLESLSKHGTAAFEKVRESASNMLEYLKNNKYVGPIITSISDAFQKLFESIKSPNIGLFDKFVSGFDSLKTFLRDSGYMTDAISMLVGAITFLKEKLFEKSPDIDTTILASVKNFAVSSTASIENFSTMLSNLPSVVGIATEAFELLKTALKALRDFIFGSEGEINLEAILDIGKSTAVLGILTQFYKLIQNFLTIPGAIAGMIGSLAGMFASVGGFIDNMSKTVKTYQKTMKAKAFKEIAISIAILAGALMLLSLIKPDRVVESLEMIAILVGMLVGIQASMSLATGKMGDLKMGGFAANLIALSAGVLILALALRKLDGVTWETAGDGLDMLLKMLGALTIAGMGLGAIGGKIGASSITLLALVTALSKMVDVLYVYSAVD